MGDLDHVLTLELQEPFWRSNQIMTCDECEIRKRHVIEQSVEMASATIEHADKPWMARRRILQRLEHQYNQAVRNLHHHTDTHNRT